MTRIALAAAALILLPRAAGAQWTVEAAAGRAVHDPVSARVSTTSASLALAYDGGGGWGYLSGGAPLGDEGPGWGAAGAGGWMGTKRGGMRIGVVAGAQGYVYGASGSNGAGSGGTVEVLPAIGWTRGPLAAELRSGFAGAADAVGDSVERRGFHDSAARLSLAAAPGLSLGAEARWVRGEGGDWPYAGASAEVRLPRGTAWAYAGAWLDEDHPDPAAAFGAGVRVRVLEGTEVQAAVRQEPFEPLYATAPRRTWSVSLSRTLGRRPGARRPAVADGWATFRLPKSDHARAPSVLGDFSGWQPVAMTEEGGWWVARVRIASGAHHYAYRTAEGETVVPPGVPAVDDGFGGRSAVLVVP